MIPRLSKAPQSPDLTLKFIETLKKSGFTGDVSVQYAERLTLATDNSVYQSLPAAIVYPRSTADISLMAKMATVEPFNQLYFAPRGGGTGTNGQSLTEGIVVDLSRHMNHILEINVEERWVRVEPGVVKDQLNAFLKPFGFFFSPELSTSNRATIGGMINTDASGQGSLVYGKTSDHVKALKAVLVNGELFDAYKMPISIAKDMMKNVTPLGVIYENVLKICQSNKELIKEKFPPLNRFLTGYDLKNVIDEEEDTIDLCRILSGSEGSLAFITEAKLNITPIPKYRTLININYDSFDSALRAAPFMLAAKALSVETIDSTVLNLAKEDIVWDTVESLVTPLKEINQIQGLNIVEYASDNPELIGKQVDALCLELNAQISNQSGVLGYQVCKTLDEIERVYAMRKKAVGLLGNAKGRAKPVAFVEDTCVPPDSLADYILEFRGLLDKYGLSYGMFGHVDAGVLHVRPALDLVDPEQESLLHEITEQVVILTQKYGGLLWGEHGKGYRAAFSPDFFGAELYRALREIKALFDPNNRLNPGKICTPITDEKALLISIESVKRGTFDRQIPVVMRDTFSGALNCNGNGLCFNYDKDSLMCPSMKVTSNRLHSPKGRAAVVREWLRLLSENGMTPEKMNALLFTTSSNPLNYFRSVIDKTQALLSKNRGEYDFSHEVKQAMDGCLSCKACASECPIKIDVPQFKAKFLHLYHTRYFRPLKDHVLAHVEQLTPWLARFPTMTNLLMNNSMSQSLIKKTIGLQDLPKISIPSLKTRLKDHPSASLTLEHLKALSSTEKNEYVLIVQDAFTSFYEANVLEDLVRLIDLLGYKPVVLPYRPNGKAQHVKGMITRFEKTVGKTSRYLSEIAQLGIPMIGLDAAMVLCYRDEYTHSQTPPSFKVLLIQEWLFEILKPLQEGDTKSGKIDEFLSKITDKPTKEGHLKASASWKIYLHCTEKAKVPNSFSLWQGIFEVFHQTLINQTVGCCGMAGTYGHEVENYQSSKELFALSWQGKIAQEDSSHLLATGFSCRSQAQRFADKQLQHPVSALLKLYYQE